VIKVKLFQDQDSKEVELMLAAVPRIGENVISAPRGISGRVRMVNWHLADLDDPHAKVWLAR
jgi:hypothetical protein